MSAEQSSKPSADQVLRELEGCERDVQALVRLAEETVDELQRLPECNAQKIEELSAAYLGKLKGISETLKLHSQVLLEAPSGGGGAADAESFLKKQEEEMAQALKLLD